MQIKSLACFCKSRHIALRGGHEAGYGGKYIVTLGVTEYFLSHSRSNWVKRALQTNSKEAICIYFPLHKVIT